MLFIFQLILNVYRRIVVYGSFKEVFTTYLKMCMWAWLGKVLLMLCVFGEPGYYREVYSRHHTDRVLFLLSMLLHQLFHCYFSLCNTWTYSEPFFSDLFYFSCWTSLQHTFHSLLLQLNTVFCFIKLWFILILYGIVYL